MELYIHIPFCVRKCRYCDFASFSGAQERIPAYIRALLAEAENRRGEVNGEIDTVYIGGGTPSLLSAKDISDLISGLRSVLPMDHVSEFSVEANPGTLKEDWCHAIRDLGVTRVSLGIQSADDTVLSSLGRIHTWREACDSVELLRKTGFTDINTDLIFGIPGQTMDLWKETLRKTVSLGPTHISAYGLIPEDGTPLKRDLDSGKLFLPDPELEREMYSFAREFLLKNGYAQYEISNFAKEGCACRHNIGYWTMKPYLGLGLSASSMTGMRREGAGVSYIRSTNPSTFEEYEKSVLSPELRTTETVSPSDARFESVMLGLRMTDGVSEEDFAALHGVSLDSCYGNKFRQFEKDGCMAYKKGRWFLTDRGMDIQNMILVELM